LNKNNINKLYKNLTVPLKKITPYIKVILGVSSLILILYLSIRSIKNTSEDYILNASNNKSVLGIKSNIEAKSGKPILISSNNLKYEIKEPSEEEIDNAWQKYQEKLKTIEEERLRKEEAERALKLQKVNLLSSYLKKMGSPMYNYTELIYDSCIKYGVDYCKLFLSIAGVETGFGRVAYAYSAWGMIGVKYQSWEEAIPRSADWIARNYYLRGYNTIEKLAYSQYHGGDEIARLAWIGNLYKFYNTIPL